MKQRAYTFLKDLYCRILDDEIFALGAQLTYYLILSIFPFLIFLLTIVSYTSITSDVALDQLKYFLPPYAYSIIVDITKQAVSERSLKLLSFGMITTIWAASNGLEALIRGLNKAYGRKDDRPYWKIRLLSILYTVALALILLFSLIMLVFGGIITQNLFRYLGSSDMFILIWDIGRYIFPLISMILIFILIYFYSPNKQKIRLTNVIPGSVFTSLGWVTISYVFSIYISRFAVYSKMYGSIGGIIALLIWLYWCSILVLIGGEINASLHFVKEGKYHPKSKLKFKNILFGEG